jgi:GT2 family glycosyltransferase
MMPRAGVTIVIPTHNRVTALMRLLRALERQLPIAGGFEVVLVVDGSTDGTAAAVFAIDWSFPLVLHEQAPSGPALARNAGAARAVGDILLFLDDDVEPMPEVVQAHARFHLAHQNSVAIGDLPPAVTADGYFGTTLRGWWHTMYEGARQPGHRYHYRDLISAHFSMPRAAFEAIRGFNPLLRSHEDWELGYRVIAAGLPLQFLPDAVALHHDEATLTKTFKRKFDDGAADLHMIEWYPALISGLPLGHPVNRGMVTGNLRRLAWTSPAIGDCIAQALRGLMRMSEMARLRFRWRAVLERLLYYSYWRGVAEASGGRDRFRQLFDRAPKGEVPEITIDLRDGIEPAKRLVDTKRPASARLMFAGEHVGDIGAEAGAERLRGEHLPKLLVERFALEYIRAASKAGAVPWSLVPQHAAAGAADSTQEG